MVCWGHIRALSKMSNLKRQPPAPAWHGLWCRNLLCLAGASLLPPLPTWYSFFRFTLFLFPPPLLTMFFYPSSNTFSQRSSHMTEGPSHAPWWGHWSWLCQAETGLASLTPFLSEPPAHTLPPVYRPRLVMGGGRGSQFFCEYQASVSSKEPSGSQM